MMENIRKEKRKHESALRLAKLLIADDTSWEHISTEEDIGKISVVNPGAKEEEEEEEEEEEGEGEIRGKNKKQGRRKTKGKQGKLGACVTTAQTPETSKANNFLDGEAGSTPTTTSLAQAPDTSKANNFLDGEAGSTPTTTSLAQAPDTSKANNLDGEAETSLLLATSNGIVEIVKEILDVYPQAVEHVSRKGQNIMHVAIKNRQKEIFNMVKKMEIPLTRLVRRIDKNGYTLLHHVAVMQYYSGGTLPGPALQLQEELHWFDVSHLSLYIHLS
jgi:ankyrin repeat protein